jgi:TonB family protein
MKNKRVHPERLRKHCRTMPIMILGLLPAARGADAPVQVKSGPGAADVDVFEGPKWLGGPFPAYPTSEKAEGKEGWVQLGMMIDSTGKPYEVTVIDSSGNAVLEQAAVKGVDRLSFRPARHGSIPVDSSYELKIAFYDNAPVNGATQPYVAGFNDLVKAVDANDRSRAGDALAKLNPRNLHEDALFGFGKYLYDRKWGTQQEQLADLRRAVAQEGAPRYLPPPVFRTALTAQLALYIDMEDYADALNVWKTLKPIVEESARDQWQSKIDKIEALRSSDEVVHTSAWIDPGTSWHGRLFKNRFGILVLGGAVSEIKLYCDKQYLFFKYEPGTQYTVNPNAGECRIAVVGRPGTVFELDQS